MLESHVVLRLGSYIRQLVAAVSLRCLRQQGPLNCRRDELGQLVLLDPSRQVGLSLQTSYRRDVCQRSSHIGLEFRFHPLITLGLRSHAYIGLSLHLGQLLEVLELQIRALGSVSMVGLRVVGQVLTTESILIDLKIEDLTTIATLLVIPEVPGPRPAVGKRLGLLLPPGISLGRGLLEVVVEDLHEHLVVTLFHGRFGTRTLVRRPVLPRQLHGLLSTDELLQTLPRRLLSLLLLSIVD